MRNVFKTAAVAAALLAPGVRGAEPAVASVHSVMIYMTVNERLEITHAQIVGGYASQDACKQAVGIVSAFSAGQLQPGETPEFLCPAARSPQPGDDSSEGPQRPKVSL